MGSLIIPKASLGFSHGKGEPGSVKGLGLELSQATPPLLLDAIGQSKSQEQPMFLSARASRKMAVVQGPEGNGIAVSCK